MERVLADDFSGAAEVAGVGFRYGLTAMVQLESRTVPACDLAVLDSDSRSKSTAEAVRLVESALDQNNWVFKKIDSVLRGHVLAEIQPFLQSGCFRRALVVPFNPELGRTIRDGIYRVNGRPISRTLFRDDPEYPALTSDVRAMLGPGAGTVLICRLLDSVPDTGILVGEGETPEDLRAWATRADEHTLPVGGAPFFAAWLESRGRKVTRRQWQKARGKVLVVSGTTSQVADWQSARPDREVRALPMPEPVFQGGSHELLTEWVKAVALALNDTGFAVASIGSGRLLERSQSARLVEHLAELAASVLTRCPVDQLWLEGGATASAIVRRMGWLSLEVVGEPAPGVVQLLPAPDGPLVVAKPGSYPWGRAGEARWAER